MLQEVPRPDPVETLVALAAVVGIMTFIAAEIKRRMSLVGKKTVSDPMEAPPVVEPEIPGLSFVDLNYLEKLSGIAQEIRAQRAASDALDAALAQTLAKAQTPAPAKPRADTQQSLPIDETITLPSGELKITPLSFSGPVILGPRGRKHWESHSEDASGEDVEE